MKDEVARELVTLALADHAQALEKGALPPNPDLLARVIDVVKDPAEAARTLNALLMYLSCSLITLSMSSSRSAEEIWQQIASAVASMNAGDTP